MIRIYLSKTQNTRAELFLEGQPRPPEALLRKLCNHFRKRAVKEWPEILRKIGMEMSNPLVEGFMVTYPESEVAPILHDLVTAGDAGEVVH